MGNGITIGNPEDLGFGFIEKDEYRFRELQNGDDSAYRHLTQEERAELERLGNYADSWDNVLVSDPFTVKNVRNNRFNGKVRLGRIPDKTLRFHDLILPVGITNSVIISSDIGNDCAVHRVSFMSHYIVRDLCMLFGINELQCTNHAKFGNGVLKEGEDPSVLTELMIMNENGNRSVLPFEDMKVADAFLWANYPEDTRLKDAFKKMTFATVTPQRGVYGEVGERTVIKGTGIIKDVKLGPYCYIKGATKLKNLTIRSCEKAPTQIGESCELVNGIIGYGCRIFYGCKAVRFIMGENSHLKYGARLINSFLGENSTVSCCEVISNLVYPFHEQHHNNSFLISSLIMGQSNMAAGANIGSNHNSRGADGELRAGRGFWPALSSTIKFDSRFASYTLISKGNYDYELNIKTPFALLSDNRREGRRQIMPAYWWMYNMYALERNSDKFSKRDGRVLEKGNIETDYLAPDTAWELFDGIRLLSKWTASALGYEGDYSQLEKEGYEILMNRPSELSGHDVVALSQEHSRSRVLVLKPVEGFNSYRDMLIYYGTKEVAAWCAKNGKTVRELEALSSDAAFEWLNLGGRLVPARDVEKLKDDVKDGRITTWDQVHEVYEKWDSEYPLEKAKNAMYCLKRVLGVQTISKELWDSLVKKLAETRAYIDDQVSKTREKDYKNRFRMITYRNAEERDAVLGSFEDNPFKVKSVEKTKAMLKQTENVVW